MSVASHRFLFFLSAILSPLLFYFLATGFSAFSSSWSYFVRLCQHMYNSKERLGLTLGYSWHHLLFTVMAILFSLVLIASLVKVIRKIMASQKLGKFLGLGNPLRDKSLLELSPSLSSCVDIVKSDQALAFCLGFFKRRIKISQKLIETLSEDELKAVIYHEEFHLKNWDNFKSLVFGFWRRVFFFVPLIGIWAFSFERNKEFLADDYAISKMGKLPLLQAFYKILSLKENQPAENLVFAGFNPTEERINRLLERGDYQAEDKRLRLGQALMAVVAFLMLFTLFGKRQSLTVNASEIMVMPKDQSVVSCGLSCDQTSIISSNFDSACH